MSRPVTAQIKRPRGRPRVRVELTPDQRAELGQRVRAHTTSQRDARRARIILACADTDDVVEAARRTGVSPKAVYRWRKRFLQHRLEGLSDGPRSGAPMRYGPVERLQIIALACEPKGQDGAINGWTVDGLREAAVERQIVPSIGRSTVHRILDQADLKPYRIQGWVHSPDPRFREKVNEITELYLNPPAEAVVICVDEKTGMQAKERKYPDKPALPGRPARREFEYIRHGTQALIAGFNVHTGKITAECGATRKGPDLVRFMEQVAVEYPEVKVHVIWDNLNIHFDGDERRWTKFNARHGGRFQFHYTPLHASWVNQIELWLAILQSKCLRHGSFKSQEALGQAVQKFAEYWNQRLARPFRWTFKGYPLQTGLPLAATG